MEDKKILSAIGDAIDELTPDIWESISSDDALTEERTYIQMDEVKKKKRRPLAWLATAAALVICFFGVNGYINNYVADSIIDIDVNPSLELVVNKQEEVIKVNALNDDAVIILDGMNLKGASLNVAINAITGSMVKNGYFDADTNDILVTVQNKDSVKAERIKDSVVADISASLNANNVNAGVYNQCVSANTRENHDNAKHYNISQGKAVFIEKLIAKDPSLTFDMLAPMSMRELAVLIEQRSIDISDFADYEYDESIYENVEEAIEEYGEYGNGYQNHAGNAAAGGTDDLYCEYCGQLKSVCLGKCANYGNERYDVYCDDCGRPESECRGSCERYDNDDDDDWFDDWDDDHDDYDDDDYDDDHGRHGEHWDDD